MKKMKKKSKSRNIFALSSKMRKAGVILSKKNKKEKFKKSFLEIKENEFGS